MQRVHTDLLTTKKRLKSLGIKVVEGAANDFTLEYEIYCCGHNENFSVWRELVKAELSVMLTNYVREFSKELTLVHDESK